jgi:transcriptional regulator with XRE-family HTH domain
MPDPKRSQDEAAPDAALRRLGGVIVAKRIPYGISQDTLAERAGINERTLRRIERGEMNPTYLMLRGIAKALDTTAAGLIAEAEATAPDSK